MPDLRPAVLFDVDGTLLDTNYLHVLAWMLPAVGAEDAVTGTTTSASVDEGKPAPDLLTTAMREHRLDPEHTVVVGDTVWDVEAARRAGLPCIALACGGISAQELRDAGAAAVHDDPADLLEHLDDSPVGRTES